MTLKVVTWYFKMADLVEQDERDLGEQVAIIACLYVLTEADYFHLPWVGDGKRVIK